MPSTSTITVIPQAIRFVMEEGSYGIDAPNSMANRFSADITLKTRFKKDATIIIGTDSCHLATGLSAGDLIIAFTPPTTDFDSISVSAEIPLIVAGRILYRVAFRYAVIGEEAP
jgi:hypothetical protein